MRGQAKNGQAASVAARRPRAAWLAIALLALGFLLLGPLCDPAIGAAAHDEPPGACCASVLDDALASAAETATARIAAGGDAAITPIAVLPVAGRLFLTLGPLAPRGVFLPEPSYYARSARIRR